MFSLRIFTEGKYSPKRRFRKAVTFPDSEESGVYLIEYSRCLILGIFLMLFYKSSFEMWRVNMVHGALKVAFQSV